MRRRIVSLVASFAVGGATLAISAPVANGVVCGGEAYVIIYEFNSFAPHGNGSLMNSRLSICYPYNVPDFWALTHGNSIWDGTAYEEHANHVCNGVPPDDLAFTRWDDCASSLKWREMPSGSSLRGCFYLNANYSAMIISRAVDADVNLTGISDNSISSFRWRNASQGC
jgi:hypothetical protein